MEHSDHYIDTVTFSPDGQTLAGGGYSAFDDISTTTTWSDWFDLFDWFDRNNESCYGDGFIGLWDVSVGTRRIFIEDICGNITDLAFSLDGQTLTSSSSDELRLWDVSTGTLRKSVTNSTFSVAFSPNGQTLATGSENELRLWDVVCTGTLLKTLTEHTKDIEARGPHSIVFSPDGRMLATGSAGGTVILWDLTLIIDTFVEPVPSVLGTLVPTETTLLQNYPNPFNPETWIPYHLAENTDVSLRIYSLDGTLIRVLMSCAYQEVGAYGSQDRAAYWDGKNGVGESVASGIYFYTLTAGEFTATRKMLIRK